MEVFRSPPYKVFKHVKQGSEIQLPQAVLKALVRTAMDSFNCPIGENEVLEHILPRDAVFILYSANTPVGYKAVPYPKRGLTNNLKIA